MDGFNNFIEMITSFIWADWVLYVVLGVGVLSTIWSGFSQYRALTHGVAVTRGKYDDPDDPGAISHFQALSAALSATSSSGRSAESGAFGSSTASGTPAVDAPNRAPIRFSRCICPRVSGSGGNDDDDDNDDDAALTGRVEGPGRTEVTGRFKENPNA